jgi:hypothetical protein
MRLAQSVRALAESSPLLSRCTLLAAIAPNRENSFRSQEDAMSEGKASSGLEHLEVSLDVAFNWGYEHARSELRELYVKGTHAQWQGDTDLDWSVSVDVEQLAMPEMMHPLFGSEIYQRLSAKEHVRLRAELTAWAQSQFLHGEQGAMLAASQLVSSVPDIDSKLYASTQVADEARHVEVFDRYLHEKVGFSYAINPHLRTLLDLILKDARWDMKLLGMQVMVEGLALAAFTVTRDTMTEPLLKDLTAHVIQDEARHVAYGVLSLERVYRDMSEAERSEREDFVYEAARLMRDRFLFQEVWEKQGLPVERCMEITFHNAMQKQFRQILFSRIVPAVKRIGLLSERQRARFAELDILRFENAQAA